MLSPIKMKEMSVCGRVLAAVVVNTLIVEDSLQVPSSDSSDSESI